MNYALWIVQGLLAAFVAYGRWRLAPHRGTILILPIWTLFCYWDFFYSLVSRGGALVVEMICGANDGNCSAASRKGW